MGVPYEEHYGEPYRPEDLEYVVEEVDLEAEEVLDSFGNRVDEDYVRRAVADARRKTAGRPSLTGEAGSSPRVSFRVPDSLRELAQQRAEKEGKTVSALAREAFEDYLRAG
ncbi:hypothetical protein ABGB12_14260 [Actinocorallia sp. B10E7]|uniref:hypothetical protein n=1 Tax=Actinocorallia sp. B10E7 TaxID=3153558 RepID=UPI00325D5C25